MERFAGVVEAIGGTVLAIPAHEVEGALRAIHPDAERVASTVPQYVSGSVDLRLVEDPHELASLELFVCEGEVGVAENGAIWVSESELVHRAAPFVAQNLAIVLEGAKLVGEMREAYAHVNVDRDGYGVFIAGPSKTADIEQSLVIGAHGPRSLTVFLL